MEQKVYLCDCILYLKGKKTLKTLTFLADYAPLLFDGVGLSRCLYNKEKSFSTLVHLLPDTERVSPSITRPLALRGLCLWIYIHTYIHSPIYVRVHVCTYI